MFVVILTTALVVFIKNEGNIAGLLGARETTTVTAAATTGAGSTEEDISMPDMSFLVICHDDDKNISFAYVIEAKPGEQKVDITPLAPDASFTAEGQAVSLSGYFAAKGIKKTAQALRDENALPVDRYISVSEENFKDIVDIFGTVTVDVTSPFTVSEDGTNYSYGPANRRCPQAPF